MVRDHRAFTRARYRSGADVRPGLPPPWRPPHSYQDIVGAVLIAAIGRAS